ncbi:hypothetical protein F5J12DRAFT_38891 [Pisolithus orientalis]|uniref:uncharacterized protein n=1 Tax=Pisolithus orientalis TaxID=936130 RepID=UPI00222517C2|nr:uncharacterized protein F5J12DRAFT_38891 [Pisolithus orientalis]KAI6009433.1 hypothetical protein F5J12DRAFT_38891 [Pisolithus orientalis]
MIWLGHVCPKRGTTYGFVPHLDRNIRHVLELMQPSGLTIRNNRGMAKQKTIPKFAFIINHVCPFRGKETGTYKREGLQRKPTERIEWKYQPVPYVLASIVLVRS